MQISYDIIPSPLGEIFVAVNQARKVVRVAYRDENDPNATLAALVSQCCTLADHPKRDPNAVRKVATQLGEYFAGERTSFDLKYDVGTDATTLQVLTWRTIAAIEYGDTWTYRDVADKIGKPGAFRSVGSACGTNPLVIVIPCHRVVRGDSRGKYTGGEWRKNYLLDLESAVLRGSDEIMVAQPPSKKQQSLCSLAR